MLNNNIDHIPNQIINTKQDKLRPHKQLYNLQLVITCQLLFFFLQNSSDHKWIPKRKNSFTKN